MATYFMFGKYSAAAVKGISAERTEKAAALAMNKLTGVSFESCPAITIAEFDRLAAAT